MKKTILSFLAGVSLFSAICLAENPKENPSRLQKFKQDTISTIDGILDDASNFPEVYKAEIEKESEKAKQRVDYRLSSLDYISRESAELEWKQEHDFFYDYDVDNAKHLAEDIAKDSLREAKDHLPEVRYTLDNIIGFFKQKFQFKVDPKITQPLPDDLPPEAEQELRKKYLIDNEAVTIETRGSSRKIVHTIFGPQAGFHTGLDVDSVDEIEYFMNLKNPEIFKSRFTEIRTGYTFGFDSSYIKSEIEKEIGKGVYVKFDAEQSLQLDSDYVYSLRFQRGLREHDSVSLRFSTDKKHGDYAGLEYRAVLPCNPLKDIKRFFFNKK